MTKPSITLLFHSGRLWHSDNSFPINVFSDTLPDGSSRMFNESIQRWLSTAYEVVNHESIIHKNDEGQWSYITCDYGPIPTPVVLRYGDLITLPEGYGIELTGLERLPPILKATITLPD